MIDIVTPVAVADIRAIERVVAIDVDVDTAAPPTPTAGAPDRRTDDHAGCKGEAGRIDVGRRVHRIRRRRIPPTAVHHRRVVRRHIHHVRLGRFHHIDRLAALRLGLHHLLRGRLQVPGRIGLGTQTLHRIHHVLLLRQESVAKLLRPVEILVHLLQHLRHGGERFDCRIPGLLRHGILERLAADLGIGLDPARRLNDLQRIGRCHQDLGE